MNGLEIALLVFALILIVISFFLVDKNDKVKQPTVAVPDMKQLNVISERAIRDMNTNANKLLESTEDSLEAISNDKIMAVEEYSDQVLAKIDANHKEVVFLYQMLQDKEKELKETMQSVDSLKADYEKQNYFASTDELSNSVPETVKEESDRSARVIDIGMNEFIFEEDDSPEPVEDSNVKDLKSKDRAKQRLSTVSSDVKQEMIKNAPAKSEKTNEVMALYKKKKSVMEISKMLDMGQGEVKLIRELYCK